MQKQSSRSRTLTGLVLLALSAACDSPAQPSPNGSDPARIRLEIASPSAVAPHQTAEARAFVVAPDGPRQDVTARVTWTTSDPAVLSVSSSGRITGSAAGETTLRATLDDLSAAASVIVVPSGTFRLAGTVTAAGSILLPGVQVQLITDSGHVLTSQTSAASEFRFYGVAGPARLRISRRGFHLYEAEIDVREHLTHDISLSPVMPSDIYRLTLSASTRCRLALPEDVRTRNYQASIDQRDGSLTVTLQGPSFFPGWGDRFAGEFADNGEVMFRLDLIEEWLQAGFFHPSGTITATPVKEGLSGFLDGELKLIRGTQVFTCTAPDHNVMFSR